MEHGWKVLGCLLLVAAPLTLLVLRLENRKIKWRIWERGEQAGVFISVIGFFAGIFLAILGCGASLPQPTDPVSVEVTACEPALGGTAGQYYQLSSWRKEVGFCEAALVEESARQAVRNFAQRDVDRLGQEFDVYRVQGRTDCYCGPVCQEMTEFLEEARQNGLFCGP